jgi:shikimate kinase
VALIYLTGMSGAGKTTVGEKLAARLGMPFVDVDQEIEQATGNSIARIFETEGEAAFRELEAIVVREISRFSHVVIALGAGALERDDSFATVSKSGTLVYLKAGLPLIQSRLQKGEPRPLLASAAPNELKERLAEMLNRRERRYLCAEVVVEIREDRTPDDTVGVLVWELARRRGPMISH